MILPLVFIILFFLLAFLILTLVNVYSDKTLAKPTIIDYKDYLLEDRISMSAYKIYSYLNDKGEDVNNYGVSTFEKSIRECFGLDGVNNNSKYEWPSFPHEATEVWAGDRWEIIKEDIIPSLEPKVDWNYRKKK